VHRVGGWVGVVVVTVTWSFEVPKLQATRSQL
jgi:hypothetical protein